MMDTANLLRSYNTALHGARYRSELQAISDNFWLKHGDVPEVGYIICQAHVDRVAGIGSPALCDQALAKAIRETTHA
jgi:hypothetical protein